MIAGSWAVAAVGAEPDYVTVHAQPISCPVEAYAQVQPIAELPVKAPAAGMLSDFAVLPGAAVKAGDVLARLTGPDIDAARARADAAIQSATAKEAAAAKTLQVLQSQLASHLSTAQQVVQAEADVSDATGAVITARAELATATLAATLRVPVAGTVTALNAAAGERVAPGDRLLTVEPSNRSWVTATVYGTDAASVHPGQKATFQPNASGSPGLVEVVSAVASPGGAGELTVGLRAVSADTRWRTGQFGTVVFQSPETLLVAVPTQALVLDQGKWWVLVRTAQGVRPAEVVPGPSRGWQTFLRSGLADGAQIVARNAYLEYHRQIASRYQPPD